MLGNVVGQDAGSVTGFNFPNLDEELQVGLVPHIYLFRSIGTTVFQRRKNRDFHYLSNCWTREGK